MTGIFNISFLLLLVGSFILDRKMLLQARTGIKLIYGIAVVSILVSLTCNYFHVILPMPAHFFVQQVSPWLSRVLGFST
ncbi:hypothetical protein A8709_05605 [Paenibacillus pectinilyticus]|uniref:Uncharacterized protein n=1 Tax=Paenibacillus pectinilyticus TaxID=512399 RepID=A0A1C0ZSV0_9BACL|nr:hypothetical protein [Paenibacillus pectinilyticus]OCT11159.1 hypothetical protein A8709_05605 [Paenibacillus pectinilyticus]